MTRIRLRHVDRFTDRHGHVRYYFRRGKGGRIALPGWPGSSEFMDAYQAAMGGERIATPTPRLRGDPGTFDRLVQDYFSCSDYARLSASSQRAYRLLIERLVHDEHIGHRLVRQMTRDHVSRIVAKRAATPAAANSALTKLRILMRFAIPKYRDDDPTLRIRKFPEGEHHVE
jgi:enterobacteria phage integrase